MRHDIPLRDRIAIAALLLCVSVPALGQETTKPASKQLEQEKTPMLSFAFDSSPWKDVIQTLAETGDLALHISDLPVGSFTYADSKSFTVDEAISRVNLFMLAEGYTLVRSGRLLSVINLSDPRSIKQLDSLAKLVTIKQLEALPDHDVVKCIFALGELDAEDAVEELSGLNLMMTPTEFSRTNRILVIDTAGKLKTVKQLLESVQPDQLDNGTVVRSFELEHVDAEDVLIVARPHLGLATGEMIGIDVSLSADPEGKNLFVTGVEDKARLVENLVKSLDKPGTDLSTADGELKLQSHPVKGGNLNSVYNVLVTLLADKEVRLSMDSEAETIVALGDEEVQARIEATVKQLEASEKEFAVIQLKTVDPYLAISLIEQMLDLGDNGRLERAGIEAFTRHGNTRGFDLINSVSQDDGPRIDADAVNRRLFVRAKKSQMEEIKKIVEQIDNVSGETDDDTLLMIPVKGKQAERLLETAARFWRGSNPVLLYPSAVTTDNQPKERVVAAAPPEEFDDLFDRPISSSAASVRLLTNSLRGTGEPIRCQMTPTGLLLQCEDPKALDAFEKHFRSISGPVDQLAAPPVVFYLKYAKPDDALRMLAELLDGAEAVKGGETGELVSGSVGSGYSSYLGSIVTSREGTTTMMNDSITVVADNRLNRLIAQGTSKDIEMIEGYLKIVDKDGSITDIETYGKTHILPLINTQASEVAAVLKEAYANRMAKATGAGAARGGQPGKEGNRREEDNRNSENKGNNNQRGRGAAAKPERNLEPQMTIAVHEKSNSLIITAPEQLYAEVEKLVKQLDTRSEQTVRIINMPNGVPQAQLIQQIFGGRVTTGPGLGQTGSSSRRSSPTSRTRSTSRSRSSR